MKRIIFAILVTFFMASNGFASTSCPIAQVIQTGAYSAGGSAILLYNLEEGVTGWTYNTYKWFIFDTSGGGDAMLATALTAIVSGRNVAICPKTAETFTDWSEIDQIWLLNYDTN